MKPTWRELLGRDPSGDPGYEQPAEERLRQLQEELWLRNKKYFTKIFTQRHRDSALTILRQYAHVWKTTVTPVPRSVAEHAIDTAITHHRTRDSIL